MQSNLELGQIYLVFFRFIGYALDISTFWLMRLPRLYWRSRKWFPLDIFRASVIGIVIERRYLMLLQLFADRSFVDVVQSGLFLVLFLWCWFNEGVKALSYLRIVSIRIHFYRFRCLKRCRIFDEFWFIWSVDFCLLTKKSKTYLFSIIKYSFDTKDH